MTDQSAHDPLPPEEPTAVIPPIKRISWAARLRAYFFAGVLVTAPISITFYLAWMFIDFVDRKVTPLIPEQYNPQQWGVPGAGLVIIVVTLTLVGALTANFFGRMLVKGGESVLTRMPVIRSIYSAVKQIFETMLAKKSNAFREVVLLEYPRRGIWTIGFITGTTVGEVQDLTSDDVLNVFIPTTPNPTSGFLLFVPRKDVRVLSMTVEEGIKLVVSGGIINPAERPPAEPGRADALLGASEEEGHR
ncbi:MAG: DUF502 domain-containing protein [Alphaproteobacteria bacterium]|nr:DUF502 domain-containing protein [Alphaproteobacteria bacterium]